MKFKLTTLTVSLAMLGFCAQAKADNQAELAQELKAVNQEMQQLQGQVKALQAQVGNLKGKLRSSQVQTASASYPRSSSRSHEAQSSQAFSGVGTSTPSGVVVAARANHTVVDQAYQQSLMTTFSQSVTIAPYTGVPTYFDGHELVVNDPSINEDVKLLNRRDQEMTYYDKIGASAIDSRPRIVLSGAIEGLTQWSSGNLYTGGSTSDINLSTAKLDTFVEGTPWISGLMSLAYDSSQGVTSANRVDNSRIFLDKGFITIGDFMKSAFYGSIGQFYVPFGRYSSSMISSPLTSFVGETKARAIVAGYHPAGQNVPYAAAYTFHSTANNPHSRIDDLGLDLGYNLAIRGFTADAGVGYITSISDSLGLQNNGLNKNTYFAGFAETAPSGVNGVDLKHNVGGGDIHAVFGLGSFALISEYVTALRNYAEEDLTFNSHGAKPQAMNNELTYSFNLWSKPSSFTLDYGFTRQALALNIPRTRYGASFQAAIMRHTLLTMEYRHDINYGSKAQATGLQSLAYIGDQLGHSSNTFTAQIGLYF